MCNCGQNWQAGTELIGQSLSFQATSSDGKMLQFDDVLGFGLFYLICEFFQLGFIVELLYFGGNVGGFSVFLLSFGVS